MFSSKSRAQTAKLSLILILRSDWLGALMTSLCKTGCCRREHHLRVRVHPEERGAEAQLLQHPQMSLHLRHSLSREFFFKF